MLDYSSWFRNLDLGSFVIIQDLVSVSNGERRRVISPWTTISSVHLNSSFCITGHIYWFSTDSNRCSGTCSCWHLLECLSLDLNHTPYWCQYFRIFLHQERKNKPFSEKVHPLRSTCRGIKIYCLPGVPAPLPAPPGKVYWFTLDQIYWRRLITL